ncbi:kinase-like domain-containing protein [Pelagophyceae sp. CCMP2097]|nr:kinase-like domain-containing protein [Pelagophyceae sp. CCMP2097]
MGAASCDVIAPAGPPADRSPGLRFKGGSVGAVAFLPAEGFTCAAADLPPLNLSGSDVDLIVSSAVNRDIPVADIELHDTLGSGSFGVVRAASWRHTPVAVKVLYLTAEANDRVLFQKEVAIMSSLHHPNIVQFLGYTLMPALALVMELFPRGSIEDYVSLEKPSNKLCLKFCTDMARGLEYLHQRRPEIIIHRDIKPQNFFLTASLCVKLGDFGIARRGSPRAKAADNSFWAPIAEAPAVGGTLRQRFALAVTPSRRASRRSLRGPDFEADMRDLTSNCGTVRYMAPEIAAATAHASYTAKVDIFSLAMVYYFVWERVPPALAGVRGPTDYLAGLRDGKRPPFLRTPKVFRALIKDMWETDAVARPQAGEILDRLQRLKCLSVSGTVVESKGAPQSPRGAGGRPQSV